MAISTARAAESLPLGKHTIACRSSQDIIDLNRTDQEEKGSISHQISSFEQQFIDYADGACREYTAGTSVYVDKETSAQGFDLVCIKADVKHKCLWALK